MLTSEQQYVIRLLRHALVGGALLKPETGLDAAAVTSYVSRGGILLTVWPSLKVWPEASGLLETNYYASVSQVVNQAREGQLVMRSLVEAGFRFVPLKGWYIRDLYPRTSMRQMTDVDLLVEDYDYNTICSVMGQLGFTPENDGESYEKHDVFHKGIVTMEVHRRLTDDSGPIRNWESRMWERVTQEPGGMLRMSPEDVYIHHFVHMRHDFVNGWFGLRRIVDTWLLQRDCGGLDVGYVNGVLESLDTARFRDRMCWLARVVMGEEPMDDKAELLIRYAFDCGIYGSAISHKAGRIAQMSKGNSTLGKISSVTAAVFLPWGRMKAQFPELERWPVLLPVCWAKRIVRYLRKGDFSRWRVMLDYRGVTGEDVEKMRRVIEAGGC